MRRLAVFLVLNLIAAAIYGLVAVQLKFFDHMSYTLFWAPDSHTYRDVGYWLLGAGPNTVESQHRPFLYPLLLALAEKGGGSPAVWGLNAICWFGTVNLTSLATYRLTGRLWVAAIVFLGLATDASLIVLSFQALTETLAAFLESLWILGLSASRLPPTRPRDVTLLLLPIALLTVVRPQFEIELVIALALVALTIWRVAGRRVPLIVAAGACCVPVVFQVGLMTATNHMVGISSTGEAEFKSYFVSQVYAELNGLPDDLVAARNVVDGWSDVQAAGYLLDHPRTAAGTFADNLHRNLTSTSNFVDPVQAPLLAKTIRDANRVYFRLHIVFLPVVVLALWRRRNPRLLLLYAFAALVTVLPSLIVDQGDRYIQVAVPLWAAAYGLAFADLLPDISHVLQRWRRTAHAV